LDQIHRLQCPVLVFEECVLFSKVVVLGLKCLGTHFEQLRTFFGLGEFQPEGGILVK
jgi:hypothetical protein